MKTKLHNAISLTVVLASISFVLAGCATAPSVPLRIPVPIECRVATPSRPAMPTDGIVSADTLDRKVKAALAELEVREGYETELRAALATCTAPLEVKP